MFAADSETARELVSKRSRRYRELRPDVDSMDDAAIIDLLVEEPLMLRRPIVFDGASLVVGYNEGALEDFARSRES